MANTSKTIDPTSSQSRGTGGASPKLTSMVNDCIVVTAVERREDGLLHRVNYRSHLIGVVNDAVCVEEFGFIGFCDPRVGIVSIRQMLGDQESLYQNPKVEDAYANRFPLSPEQRQEIFTQGVFY